MTTEKTKTSTTATPKPHNAPTPPVVRKKRKVNYLNNKDLLAEVILSKEQDKMSDKLAHMLQTLVSRYGKKGNWANYTYNEDMQGYAMVSLVHTWKSFKPEKSNNPFAFFTQCTKNSFIQFLNQEKKQRDVRDRLLIDQGLSPSHTFQLEHESRLKAHKEVDAHDQHIDDDHDIDTPSREETGDDMIDAPQ